MNNNRFRENVYNKYYEFKNIRNDDFFNRHHYKSNIPIILNRVAIFMIGIMMVFRGRLCRQYNI